MGAEGEIKTGTGGASTATTTEGGGGRGGEGGAGVMHDFAAAVSAGQYSLLLREPLLPSLWVVCLTGR